MQELNHERIEKEQARHRQIAAAGQTSPDCCRRSDIIRLLPQVRHHQIAAAGQDSDIIRLLPQVRHHQTTPADLIRHQ